LKTFSFFILGLLIGWLIEWVIDFMYWRKRYNQALVENANLKEQITALQAEKASPPKSRVKKAVPAKVKPKKDDLKLIVGIGPVIAKKLNDSGITTFEQMAKLKPNQLEEILGELVKRLSDEADLISQARELARKNKSKA